MHSNTTLVKVKFDGDMMYTTTYKFKYNTC